MQIAAPPPPCREVSGMTFDKIRFRGEGGNARSQRAATFTVFPRGFPLVTPIVIRYPLPPPSPPGRRGGGGGREDDATIYILADTALLSSSLSASGSTDFTSGTGIDRGNCGNGMSNDVESILQPDK